MLLAIEQGNTNTMFAVHDGQRWIAQWRAARISSASNGSGGRVAMCSAKLVAGRSTSSG